MSPIQVTLENVPQFYGTSKENIKSYFVTFEGIATIAKWSYKERRDILAAYGLQGHANHFYSALPADVKTSYRRIKETLLNYFASSDTRILKKAELANLKQKKCASIDAYIDKVEDLTFQLDYNGEKKLDSLIFGLNEDLRVAVMLKRFKTFSDAVAYIKLKNAIKPKDKEISTEMLKKLHEKVEKLTEIGSDKEVTVQSTSPNPKRVVIDDYTDSARYLNERIAELINQKLQTAEPQAIDTFGQPNFALTTDSMREIERMKAEIRSLKRQEKRPQQNRRNGFKT